MTVHIFCLLRTHGVHWKGRDLGTLYGHLFLCKQICDITVAPPTINFTANGMSVHNGLKTKNTNCMSSTHINPPIQMFLHCVPAYTISILFWKGPAVLLLENNSYKVKVSLWKSSLAATKQACFSTLPLWLDSQRSSSSAFKATSLLLHNTKLFTSIAPRKPDVAELLLLGLPLLLLSLHPNNSFVSACACVCVQSYYRKYMLKHDRSLIWFSQSTCTLIFLDSLRWKPRRFISIFRLITFVWTPCSEQSHRRMNQLS